MPRDIKTKRFAEQVSQDTSSGYMPLVTGATAANVAQFNSDGEVEDSGYATSGFSLTTHDHKTAALYLLASATINGQTLTKQIIYTVPAGKTMIPHALIVRSPSATLAGLVDMDIGGDANASDWLQEITLNAFTATTDYGLIVQPEQAAGPPIVPVKKTLYAAATVFGIKIITGSTGIATFTIDLFGYLF